LEAGEKLKKWHPDKGLANIPRETTHQEL